MPGSLVPGRHLFVLTVLQLHAMKILKINSVKFISVLPLMGILAGCATYKEEPLSFQPSWPAGISRLKMDTANMPLPELASHKFDPGDGLDMTEVAMLAVANNPQLKLARDDLGIARAQAFSAGLLPDPQVSFTPQIPQNGMPGENVTAYDLGLNYNISALVMRASGVAIAKAETRKTDLALLWQEWQVVGQARLLFARDSGRRALLQILQDNRAIAALRYRREKTALDSGNLTLTAVALDADALQGIDKQINETERLIEQNRHALNALLGLSPDTRLHLVGAAILPDLNREAIAAKLPDLARHRPDLMALKHGYDAQDMKVRQAILAQFPAIGFGLLRARDNTGIIYNGFSISLSLPIFNRNRGNIAIAKATRHRMHDEFQARLNTAYSDVEQLLSDQGLLEKQLKTLDQDLSSLSRLAGRADAAFETGDMSLATYYSLKNALSSKEVEKNMIEESMLEERIALQTLVGGELPTKESK